MHHSRCQRNICLRPCCGGRAGGDSRTGVSAGTGSGSQFPLQRAAGRRAAGAAAVVVGCSLAATDCRFRPPAGTGTMTHAWPAELLGQAVGELARAAGLSERVSSGKTIDRAASSLGLEAEEVFSTYAEFEATLSSIGPAMLRVGDNEWLAILGRRGRRLRLVTPTGIHSVLIHVVQDAICGPLEEAQEPAIAALLDCVKTPAERRKKARAILLRERLGLARIRGMWLLRLGPDAPFRKQLKVARVPQRIFLLAVLHAIQ